MALHRHAERADRGGLHRPRPGARRSANRTKCSARSTSENEELYQSSFGAQFISGTHPARDDVPRQPQLPRHRGHRRAARLLRADEHRRHPGVHPVLAPVHPAAHAAGVDGQRAAVGHRVARAGLRAARRRRAEPRPRRAAHRRRAAGPHRVRRRALLLRPEPTAHRGPVAGRRAGRDRRHRRPHRRRARPRWSTWSCGSTSSTTARSRSTACDVAEMRRHDLRANVGMVLQDTWLFEGTIRENIAFGNPDATEEQIVEAAKATHVDHFVRSLPDGYDTVVDDEGTQRVGRREAAAHHRPRLPRRPHDPHPRRGDQLGRHPHRGADPEGDGRAAHQPHELRDRAPAVDHPRRRHHPGDGETAPSSSRATTRSCSSATARTPSLYNSQFAGAATEVD